MVPPEEFELVSRRGHQVGRAHSGRPVRTVRCLDLVFEYERHSTAQELDAQAIALRRAGKSRREIKQILGVGNSTLDRALRGVPPQPWTRRPRAKDDLHEKARDLRSRGYTYTEIAAELGVSKGSVSLWVRDLPRVGRISYEETRKRNAEGVSQVPLASRRAFGARSDGRRSLMRLAAEVGPLNDREILIVGAIAYWCEGTKSKPYRPDDRIAIFVNSDPQLGHLLPYAFLAVCLALRLAGLSAACTHPRERGRRRSAFSGSGRT